MKAMIMFMAARCTLPSILALGIKMECADSLINAHCNTTLVVATKYIQARVLPIA